MPGILRCHLFNSVIVLLNSGKLWDATVGIENATQNKVALSIPGNLSKVIVSGNPLDNEKASGILSKASPEALRMRAGIIHKHWIGCSSKSSKLGFLWQDNAH